jgi:hypothetical protein
VWGASIFTSTGSKKKTLLLHDMTSCDVSFVAVDAHDTDALIDRTSGSNSFRGDASNPAPISSSISSARVSCVFSYCLEWNLLLETLIMYLKIVLAFGTGALGNFRLNLP